MSLCVTCLMNSGKVLRFSIVGKQILSAMTVVVMMLLRVKLELLIMVYQLTSCHKLSHIPQH